MKTAIQLGDRCSRHTADEERARSERQGGARDDVHDIMLLREQRRQSDQTGTQQRDRANVPVHAMTVTADTTECPTCSEGKQLYGGSAE